MLVYIYDKKTNEKLETFKNCMGIISDKKKFLIITEDDKTKEIEKKAIKLVVYGF